MRSWVKALLISVAVLSVFVIYLPNLGKQGLNSLLPWLMEQADLTQPKFHISTLDWHKIEIDRIAFSAPKHSASIELKQLSLSYSPWHLIKGLAKDLSIEQVSITLDGVAENTLSKKNNKINSDQNNTETPGNDDLGTDPRIISLLNAKEIFSSLPIQSITIDNILLQHPQGTVNSQIQLTPTTLMIDNQISLQGLQHDLLQQLSFNNQGQLNSQINVVNNSQPIFILQGQWLQQDAETMAFSLQQTADIQYWLAILDDQQQANTLDANIAIQTWNLTLKFPKQFSNDYSLLNKLSGDGALQMKIEDFNLTNSQTQSELLEHADLAINILTKIDPSSNNQWQLIIDTFEFNTLARLVEQTPFNIRQFLNQPLAINCNFNNDSSACQWQGEIQQKVIAEKFTSQVNLAIDGDFKQTLHTQAQKLKTQFNSRNTLSFELDQQNPLWPKFNNTAHGDIILGAEKDDNAWHWQLNLPYGFNGKSQYNEPLPPALQQGKLSNIQWQLLPDWQIQGIETELTQAKALSILIKKLAWKSERQMIELDLAKFSCELDWLKLQYSPQLRSRNAIADLPLSCDWQIKNKTSQWLQWPIPAIKFNGSLNLSSLDFTQALLHTEMKIEGLNDRLDISLNGQHDFGGKQQGAAQLYLNNLKLDWQELGLSQMENLTQAQLLAGNMSAQGWIHWQQYQTDIFDDNSIAWRWQPDIMLRVDDMAGVYKTTTWEDIDFQMAIRRPFYEDFKIDTQISALSINPGIEVANILARSTTTVKPDFSQALIVIEEVHSDVLGGRINVPLIRFDTRQAINAFGIEIEGLKIDEMVALEPDSGIKATGRLDGVLPVLLLPEGPQIPAGSLYARAPGGIVQYRSQTADSLKKSDPNVSLAMQVLDDFHYHKLQTDITYQPNGELNLELQFQGNNPTFFDGQATHFNLNLEYNLLDFLESLRISNDIVQKLENKYQ